MQTQWTRDAAKPAPKRLTHKRETLRRLTPAELRLAAGGLACGQGKHIPEPRIVA